jgi:hypothetical protein
VIAAHGNNRVAPGEGASGTHLWPHTERELCAQSVLQACNPGGFATTARLSDRLSPTITRYHNDTKNLRKQVVEPVTNEMRLQREQFVTVVDSVR